MYSNKFAAKLMNIRRLCKENVRNLSIFMVLSTHYPTFRLPKMSVTTCQACSLVVMGSSIHVKGK